MGWCLTSSMFCFCVWQCAGLNQSQLLRKWTAPPSKIKQQAQTLFVIRWTTPASEPALSSTTRTSTRAHVKYTLPQCYTQLYFQSTILWIQLLTSPMCVNVTSPLLLQNNYTCIMSAEVWKMSPGVRIQFLIFPMLLPLQIFMSVWPHL